jgi:hypothetical protein
MRLRNLVVLILLGGGFNMAMATKSTQSIIDHAKKHLSLSEKEISVIETPITGLPHHLEVYYVENKKSHNVYYRYVISDGELFCSEEKDSFDRLLKKERYLERKNFTVDQLIMFFGMLKAKFHDMKVINEADLTRGGLFEEYESKAAPPTISESRDGVKVVFYTSALAYPEPQKWTFTISPDYHVDYRSE